jgi:hypothetical protein
LLTDHRSDELVRLTRNPLPEEGGARRATPTPTPKAGAKKGEPAAPLVNRNSFEVQFRCEPGSLQLILNGLVTAKNQLYVIRNINIENTRQTPPNKEEIKQKITAPAADTGGVPQIPPAPGQPQPPTPQTPQTPPTPQAPVDPNAPPAPTTPAPDAAPAMLAIVVGEEHVTVTMLVEIADVTPPPQPETKGKKK